MSAFKISAAPLLASAALLLVPFAMLAEGGSKQVWQERLFAPLYKEGVNLHTPQKTEGTYLPPVIAQSQTYTVAHSPLILTRETNIPAGITVTIEPGVTIVAHEFATVRVAGTLAAIGTAEHPILFTTNEEHSNNQNWGGLLIENSGQANLAHLTITHASPALSCLKDSRVTAEHLHTDFGLVGLYTESNTCLLSHSRLQAIQHGVIARGIDPRVIKTNISAGKQNIVKF